MSCHRTVAAWTRMIHTHLPHVSKPQATVPALWSLGMVLARSCALTAVSVWLATLLPRQENTVHQPLRAWCDEAEAKRGDQRQVLVVAACCVPLRQWIVRTGQGTQVALALAATTRGTRFTVLAISVVSRGCAIPVAWTMLPATVPHAGRREGLRMRRLRRPAMPHGWTVIVLADWGLSARWRFRRIVRLGWHPLMRINTGGTSRPDPQAAYRPLARVVPQPGTRWQRTGTAVKSPQRQLRCTRLACWEPGYTAPWVSLTDVPPDASAACWDWLAGLDRTGLQGAHTGRLAVAAHAHDRAPAGRTPVAGGGGRDAVAVERWRGRRCDPRPYPARCVGGSRRPPTAAAGHPSVPGQHVSPGMDHHPGGVAQPGPTAPGRFPPRALADGACVRL